MALNWNKEVTLGGAKEPDRSAAGKVAQQGDADARWEESIGMRDMRYGARDASMPEQQPEQPVQLVQPLQPEQQPAAPAQQKPAAVTKLGMASSGSGTAASAAKAPKRSLMQVLQQPIGGKGKGDRAGQGKGHGGAWPSKTTINLYVRPSHALEARRAIPLAIGLAVLVFAVAKFGVLDQLARVTAKQSELMAAQAQLAQAESQLGDYDEVKDEYEAYNVQTSSTGIDVLGALDLVDAYVKPSATVDAESIQDATMTVEVSGASLDTVGKIANTLRQQPQVAAVTVAAANNQQTSSSESVVVTLTITLNTIAQTNAVAGGAQPGTAGSNAVGASEADAGDAAADYVDSTVNNVQEATGANDAYVGADSEIN